MPLAVPPKAPLFAAVVMPSSIQVFPRNELSPASSTSPCPRFTRSEVESRLVASLMAPRKLMRVLAAVATRVPELSTTGPRQALSCVRLTSEASEA